MVRWSGARAVTMAKPTVTVDCSVSPPPKAPHRLYGSTADAVASPTTTSGSPIINYYKFKGGGLWSNKVPARER
ncbi:hypothetical protein L6164_007926 [Bauhinia variegata]|uniref:Uncharacterized protein n=1 Tax=Bauhinia variegata TaxID=167791 RepID=A0ACB9PF17_BAUVA|nr:hypothetical protein L6164_007926 [Bauhinia variegata]